MNILLGKSIRKLTLRNNNVLFFSSWETKIMEKVSALNFSMEMKSKKHVAGVIIG